MQRLKGIFRRDKDKDKDKNSESQAKTETDGEEMGRRTVVQDGLGNPDDTTIDLDEVGGEGVGEGKGKGKGKGKGTPNHQQDRDQDQRRNREGINSRTSQRILAGPKAQARAVIAIDFGSTHSGYSYATTKHPDRVYIPRIHKSTSSTRGKASNSTMNASSSSSSSSASVSTPTPTPTPHSAGGGGGGGGTTIDHINTPNSVQMTRKVSAVSPNPNRNFIVGGGTPDVPGNTSDGSAVNFSAVVPPEPASIMLEPGSGGNGSNGNGKGKGKEKEKGKERGRQNYQSMSPLSTGNEKSGKKGRKQSSSLSENQGHDLQEQAAGGGGGGGGGGRTFGTGYDSSTGHGHGRGRGGSVFDSEADTTESLITERAGKEPTCALFDRKMNLLRYGQDAREWFLKVLGTDQMLNKFTQSAEVSLMEDYLYFEGSIKMRLWGDPSEQELECTTLGNSFTVPLIEVVARILEHIKNDAIRHLLADCAGELGEDFVAESHILWVLTVPAIWREEDKQFMRRAAFQAGLIQDVTSIALVLALEPECAAIAAQAYELPLGAGTKLLTLDCGGGTVDICGIEILSTAENDNDGESPDSQHRDAAESVVAQVDPIPDEAAQNPKKTADQVLDRSNATNETGEATNASLNGKFEFKQLLKPTGGNWGSKNIDDNFLKFFEQFLGKRLMHAIEESNPAATLDLMNQWEKLKCKLTADDLRSRDAKARWSLDLSHFMAESDMKLNGMCKKWNETYSKKEKGCWLEAKAERRIQDPSLLILPAPLLRTFFDPVIDSITRYVGSLLDKHGGENGALSNLDGMLLVGGFGKCDLLRRSFEEKFGARLQAPGGVWFSERSAALVETGAVLFGLQPSVIRSRLARLTIGVKATLPYKSSAHRGNRRFRENKFYDRRTKKHYIRNVFKPFVTRGQEVNVSTEVIHRFAPRNPDLETVKFELFYLDDEEDEDENEVDDGQGSVAETDGEPIGGPTETKEEEKTRTAGGTLTRFVNEPGCKRLCEIVVDVEKGAMPTLECAMFFGFTEITAVVTNTKTKEEKRILFNFEHLKLEQT